MSEKEFVDPYGVFTTRIDVPSTFPSNSDLTGKKVLVTGGGRGLGVGIALAFAAAGADVAVSARTKTDVEEVAQRIEAKGVKGCAVAGNVKDAESVQKMVATVVAEFGKIDVLVNNAGISPWVLRPEKYTEEQWDEMMGINVKGCWLCAKEAFLQSMKDLDKGRIINTGSAFGLIGDHRVVPYCTSKGAVLNFTRALAVDWAPYNITVNNVAPGFFDSPLIEGYKNNEALGKQILDKVPLKRWGRIEELVGTYIFLASDASSFITGQTIYVDGGMTIL